MEFIPDTEETKLPTIVKVVGIIQLVVSALALIGGVVALAMYSTIEQANTTGVKLPSKGMYIISLLIVVALIASIIMIFLKNKIGVFAYIAVAVVNFILGIVMAGVTISSFIGLILPILMIVFIFKEKEIFGL